MKNSADPDQLASSDLHCLLRQGMSCSAREGLRPSLGLTNREQIDYTIRHNNGYKRI